MSLQVDVIERGAAKAAWDLRALGVRAADAQPAWEEMNVIFHADEERRFALHGPGWAPLSDQSLPGPQLMVQTGTLKRSLTTGSAGRRTEGDRLAFGTDVEYARFHQYGTQNMPRRQVVGLSPAAQRRMVRVLERWIVHGAGL